MYPIMDTIEFDIQAFLDSLIELIFGGFFEVLLEFFSNTLLFGFFL